MAGRPRLTRGGQTLSVWVGIPELRRLRAYAERRGCRNLSEAVRSILRELDPAPSEVEARAVGKRYRV